jgi:hypothetical protein
VDGKELCECRFKVQWTAGERRGELKEVGIEDVSYVQNSPVQDPVLTEFLDSVTKSSGNGDATAATQAAGAALPQ